MELSEEEKKVIEYLKNYCNTDLLYEQKHYDYINFLIKSFEKQHKEIEELKEKQDYARLEKEQLLEDSVNKDKIREKIKELEEDDKYEYLVARENIIITLKELLEEN